MESLIADILSTHVFVRLTTIHMNALALTSKYWLDYIKPMVGNYRTRHPMICKQDLMLSNQFAHIVKTLDDRYQYYHLKNDLCLPIAPLHLLSNDECFISLKNLVKPAHYNFALHTICSSRPKKDIDFLLTLPEVKDEMDTQYITKALVINPDFEVFKMGVELSLYYPNFNTWSDLYYCDKRIAYCVEQKVRYDDAIYAETLPYKMLYRNIIRISLQSFKLLFTTYSLQINFRHICLLHTLDIVLWYHDHIVDQGQIVDYDIMLANDEAVYHFDTLNWLLKTGRLRLSANKVFEKVCSHNLDHAISLCHKAPKYIRLCENPIMTMLLCISKACIYNPEECIRALNIVRAFSGYTCFDHAFMQKCLNLVTRFEILSWCYSISSVNEKVITDIIVSTPTHGCIAWWFGHLKHEVPKNLYRHSLKLHLYEITMPVLETYFAFNYHLTINDFETIKANPYLFGGDKNRNGTKRFPSLQYYHSMSYPIGSLSQKDEVQETLGLLNYLVRVFPTNRLIFKGYDIESVFEYFDGPQLALHIAYFKYFRIQPDNTWLRTALEEGRSEEFITRLLSIGCFLNKKLLPLIKNYPNLHTEFCKKTRPAQQRTRKQVNK